LDETHAAITGMLDWPNAAPPVPDWHREPLVRHKRVKVFPYRIVCYVADIEIAILAYTHQRCRPG